MDEDRPWESVLALGYVWDSKEAPGVGVLVPSYPDEYFVEVDARKKTVTHNTSFDLCAFRLSGWTERVLREDGVRVWEKDLGWHDQVVA